MATARTFRAPSLLPDAALRHCAECRPDDTPQSPASPASPLSPNSVRSALRTPGHKHTRSVRFSPKAETRAFHLDANAPLRKVGESRRQRSAQRRNTWHGNSDKVQACDTTSTAPQSKAVGSGDGNSEKTKVMSSADCLDVEAGHEEAAVAERGTRRRFTWHHPVTVIAVAVAKLNESAADDMDRTNLGLGELGEIRPEDLPKFSCRHPRVPNHTRVRFAIRTYWLVFAALACSSASAAPFLFAPERALLWMAETVWLFASCGALVIAQQLFHTYITVQMAVSFKTKGCLLTLYVSFFQTGLVAHLYFLIYSGCFGLVAGKLLADHMAPTAIVALPVMATMVLVLMAHANRCRGHFRGGMGYCCVIGVGAVFVGMLGCAVKWGSPVPRILSCFAATILSCVAFHDLQLMFGAAPSQHSDSDSAFEYQVGMHTFAAWNMYLNCMNVPAVVLRAMRTRDARQ